MKKSIALLLFITCSICNQIPGLENLSIEQKIGQLFMIPAISIKQDKKFIENSPYKKMKSKDVKRLIEKYGVGGVIFLGKGRKKEQQELTKEFQKSSAIPLLIGLDAEWGSGMRLLDGLSFPRAGLLQDKDAQYVQTMAKKIGKELKELGVHINFAPVVDVNNNPKNPIIGTRAFSDDKKEVASKAIAYMQGLHEAGIISCAKHFPGHGDTTVDSHKDLPVIDHDMDRLQEIELYPFTKMIAAGVPMIMMAHLLVPTLDKKMPTSLSKKTISFLREKLTFNGIVITDGLGMQALTKKYQPGQIELQALLAGNDILLCPVDVPKAVELIKQALKDGRLTEEELDQHVARILEMKKKIFS